MCVVGVRAGWCGVLVWQSVCVVGVRAGGWCGWSSMHMAVLHFIWVWKGVLLMDGPMRVVSWCMQVHHAHSSTSLAGHLWPMVDESSRLTHAA